MEEKRRAHQGRFKNIRNNERIEKAVPGTSRNRKREYNTEEKGCRRGRRRLYNIMPDKGEYLISF